LLRSIREFTSLYPAVALTLIALHLWAASGVSPFAAVRGLAVVFLVALVLAAIAGILMRDKDRGALLGLLLIMAVAAGGRQPVPLLAVLGGLLIAVERFGPWQPTIHWPWVSLQLRRATSILALAVLLEAIQLGRIWDLVTSVQRETPFRANPTVAAHEDAPEVYVILLDGYARHDILGARFGLDDSPFLDGLRTRGFQVASENHSNYIATIPSLSSFLNFRQIADITTLRPLIENPGMEVGPSIYRATSQAAILDRFRERGYETIAVASGFEQSAVRGVDRFIDIGQLNDFEMHLLRPSLIATFLKAVAPDTFSGSQRDRIESAMSVVEQLASEDSPRPRFIFAHVPSPHRPWVSNADGSPRVATDLETWYFDTPQSTGMSRQMIITGFVGQTTYIGQRALQSVDTILVNSSRPPIILILSDHGPSLDVDASNIETRLRNLFAAYTPGHDHVFADDVTLVNVFPSMFEAYFDVALPRANETLYGPGPRGLFDPVPVIP
jgi:Sulfatase